MAEVISGLRSTYVSVRMARNLSPRNRLIGGNYKLCMRSTKQKQNNIRYIVYKYWDLFI